MNLKIKDQIEALQEKFQYPPMPNPPTSKAPPTQQEYRTKFWHTWGGFKLWYTWISGYRHNPDYDEWQARQNAYGQQVNGWQTEVAVIDDQKQALTTEMQQLRTNSNNNIQQNQALFEQLSQATTQTESIIRSIHQLLQSLTKPGRKHH